MHNWWTDYRWRRPMRLWGPVILIVVLSIGTALLSWRLMNRGGTPSERAERVAEMGDMETAERLHWQLLEAHPNDLRNWIDFIDAHAAVTGPPDEEEGGDVTLPSRSSIDEARIRRALAKVGNAEVSTLASYWYQNEISATKPDRARVVALADRQPPAPFANHLLARAAWKEKDAAEAAHRFEREGLAFPKMLRDLREAIAIWIDKGMWDEVRRCARDPRYKSIRDAVFRLELAEHERDWIGILRWLWPASFVGVGAWPIALALLSAILWFSIAGRLGRLLDGVEGRRALYLFAILLGVLSVYPTLVAISVEESIFGFKLMDQPIPDFIYYVFGVGLREELSKLLLFLPLLPALLKRGLRIEAMTCGALVGLGFAAEENIQYFQHLSGAAAISRFLTANFLHMALTSLVALSVFDTARGRQTSRDGFNLIFPLAVGIHGVYDFLLSTTLYSIVAMVLLIVVARAFLRQLLIASSSVEQQGLMRLFVWSLTLLAGATYVYATTVAGPLIAIPMVGIGLLGVAILIFIFVRELGSA